MQQKQFRGRRRRTVTPPASRIEGHPYGCRGALRSACVRT
ncbi:hypothetical protein NY08_1501 [Rhodococcus sp. B7740]|nr:hypothetical protein NY08_1501 [Rhodococcus sp. B7740]